MDYLSRFDFDITYVNTHMDIHDVHDYVRANAHIDPAGEDLPNTWYAEVTSNVVEIQALQEVERWRSRHLQEAQENRNIEARILKEAEECIGDEPTGSSKTNLDAVDNPSNATNANTIWMGSNDPPMYKDISLGDAIYNRLS